MEIAKIAAASEHDCEELCDIAELSVLKLSGQVVELAQLAAKGESEEEKNHIREAYIRLKNSMTKPSPLIRKSSN